ncbi:2-oxoglutarate and iron-dependent oxygenase domain-containing protein [Rhizobium sp. WYCCWR10014]|uniref:2-oxoglutarate and iron-dependent oxygenase domain-containing protein n=1 Tax=Rhizobium sp. WYCCWR10014 TaxID=1825933 RepID=UPI0032AE8249
MLIFPPCSSEFSKKDNAVTAAARTLPILDLGRFASAHPGREQALAELRDVSRTLGFFYLTGHGIPQRRQRFP